MPPDDAEQPAAQLSSRPETSFIAAMISSVTAGASLSLTHPLNTMTTRWAIGTYSPPPFSTFYSSWLEKYPPEIRTRLLQSPGLFVKATGAYTNLYGHHVMPRTWNMAYSDQAVDLMKGYSVGASRRIIQSIPGYGLASYLIPVMQERFREKTLESPYRSHIDAAIAAITGSAFGAAGALVSYPLGTIETVIQTDPYAGSLANVIRSRGLGLFHGVSVEVCGAGIGAGLLWGTHHALTQYEIDREPGKELTFYQKLSSFMVAGSIATVLTNPFNVVTARIQAAPKEETSIRKEVYTLFKNGDAFRGISPNLFLNACKIAFGFAAVTHTTRALTASPWFTSRPIETTSASELRGREITGNEPIVSGQPKYSLPLSGLFFSAPPSRSAIENTDEHSAKPKAC